MSRTRNEMSQARADRTGGDARPSKDAKSDRIRVRREWVGAPEGTLTNPTVWLFALASLGFGGTAWAYLAAGLPALAAIGLNTVAIYVAFTVMHDSVHGTAHKNKTVNAWLGRPMALLLTVSPSTFRAVHFEHHSHTNDPERDPDLFVSRAPKWLLPVWAMGVMIEYRRHYFGRKLWRNRTELIGALGVEVFLVSTLTAALLTGHFASLAVVWLIPATFATVFLAMAFDYLPHYPYDSRERYRDTRVMPGRVGFVVLLGQNYHLIHHLWTTVPWYRYRRVFQEIRPELEARGARIGWRVEPSPDRPSVLLGAELETAR